MDKARRLVTLSNDISDDIAYRMRHDDFNFSDWVDVTYAKEFMTESSLKKKLDYHKKQQKNILNKIDHLKSKRVKILNFLKNSKSSDVKLNTECSRQIIEQHPEKAAARLKLFNNEFNTDLTQSEFLDLLGLMK